MDSSASTAMEPPPQWRADDGAMRRIGAEIEFSALDCRESALIVQRRFGGRLEEVEAWRYYVLDSEFGDFTIELDTQYAHARQRTQEEADGDLSEFERRIADTLDRELSEALGDIGSLWLPIEIVSPPVPLDRLPDLDPLVADLRAAGAEGTDEALVFAFATQLNMEVVSREPSSVLAHLKAYLLLSEELRAEIDPHLTRRLLPFSDPFPRSYVGKVVDPAYQPDLATMIDDYLAANATRNRGLDMLPLFAELERQGRILHRRWSQYDGQHVVFQPEGMSVSELQLGTEAAWRHAYSWRSLASRLRRSVAPWHVRLASNLAYRFYARRLHRFYTCDMPSWEGTPVVAT